MRLLITIALIAAIIPSLAYGTEISGDVFGVWNTEGNPYDIVGDITVPAGSTLTIDPGVIVNFKGFYKFTVDSTATLTAVGTESDSIYFTAEDTSIGWNGIRFINSDSASIVSYSHLEYGKANGGWENNNGGAIYCYHSNPTISNNTLTHNYAENYGGAISCDGASPIIDNNIMTYNTAYAGAGVDCENTSAPIITDNIIQYGSTHRGGGICADSSNPIIDNNVITENSAVYGGGIICRHHASANIDSNEISNNTASYGGGIASYYSDPIINDNNVTENTSSNYGAGIQCYSSDAQITGNIIKGNTCNYEGGGLNSDTSTPIISRNLIIENTAYAGAGIYFNSSDAEVMNNTISANDATYEGGGITCNNSNPVLTNNIIWGDIVPDSVEVFVLSGSPQITYCDIQGGMPGNGNIDSDPLFVNASAGDYHLRGTSPCIDSGDPTSTFDNDGSIADMGAYYFDHSKIFAVDYDSTQFTFATSGNHIISRTFNFISYDTTGYILPLCDSSWVSFEPDSVQLSAFDTVAVIVSFDPTGLDYDSVYSTEITFQASAPGLEGETIPVEMSVIPQQLSVVYDSADFTFDIIRDSLIIKTFKVIYDGDEDYGSAYVIPVCDSSWVFFEPDSITLNPGDTVEVTATFSAAGLDYSNYGGEISFDSDSPTLDNVHIPINMTVFPLIPVESVILSETRQIGDTLECRITIENPTDINGWCYLSTGLILPDSTAYGPIFGPFKITLLPNGTTSGIIRHLIPQNAPIGDYKYIATTASSSSMEVITGADSSDFTVTPVSTSNDSDEWEVIYFSFQSGEDGVGNESFNIPTDFSTGCYPNPFNAIAKIHYNLPSASKVQVEIYNIDGQMVERLVDGFQQAGEHSVDWNASRYSSGVYFYRVYGGGKVLTKKMTLLK